MTTANVTMGLKFSGTQLGSDAAATVRGLRNAFADLALGFDPSLVYVSPTPDPTGGAGGAGAAAMQGASSLALNGRKLLGGPRAAGGRRRLAQLAPLQAAGGGAAAAARPWGADAYASYTGLSPSSVQMLTNALDLNCGMIVPGQRLPGGRAALEGIAAPLRSVSHSSRLNESTAR
jgi:hypothetical protein